MSELLATRGPSELQFFLQTKREELDKLDHDLQLAHELAESCEEEWTQHLDVVMEDLMATGDRLPGEDVRLSIARSRGGWEKWTTHRRAEKAVKRLEQRASLIAKQISACQSEARIGEHL